MLISGIGDFGATSSNAIVRRICSDQSEIGTCSCKFGDSSKQIISHAGKIVCSHEVESLLQINAVNDEFRITPAAGALAIKGDDLLIIIDRALRPKATDDSKSFHLLTTNPPSPALRRDK